MNIQFTALKIQSFQSIGIANLNLSSRGIVTIVGVNNYENNAQSNGSGKSSLMAALFWCLYGKTPEGIVNPTNRYSPDRCQVSAEFQVDTNKYSVVRYMNKASQVVDIEINNEKQSARNKSDSDKLIRDDILKLSPDLFLSLIYLSQGFSNRLSSLSPTARKDRLEQLTNTSELIDGFSTRASKVKQHYQEEFNKLNAKINQNNGSINTYSSIIESIKQSISKAEELNANSFYEFEGIKYTADNVSEIQSRIEALREEDSEVDNKIYDMSSYIQQCTSQKSSQEAQLNRNKSDIKQLEAELASLETQGVCPTCRQQIQVTDKASLIQERKMKIAELQKINKDIDIELQMLENKRCKSVENKVVLDSKSNELKTSIRKYSSILANIPVKSNVDISKLKSDIKINEDKCKELEEANVQLNQQSSKVNDNLLVVTHCQQLITKQFRAYLLKTTIEFLNGKLKEYSNYLFSNADDIIKVSDDSQKLDIYLGDNEYATLSGGERRRVDLALMLAQRDLASEIAGMTSSMLILDEIMESMDETATQVTLSLLENQSQSLDSMFIISHNNYAMPVDSRIIVTKGIDRVSTVEEK